LIVDFPEFQYEKKDIIGSFWKNCFYKHIEEFRKSIKKLKTQYEANPYNQPLKLYLAKLSQEFLSFLHDSSRFIQKLMTDVREADYSRFTAFRLPNYSDRSKVRPAY
jgi:hypothetical protein